MPIEVTSLHGFTQMMKHPAVEMTVAATPGSGNNPHQVTGGQITLTASTPSAPFWASMRRLLIDEPQLCADMTGLPKLVTWHQYEVPAKAVKLQHIRNLYVQHSNAKSDSKDEAARTFNSFLDYTKAETLDDLTTDRLTMYREHVKGQGHLPGTVAAYFGRVKHIIRFAKSEGESTPQIDAALSRLAVLKAPPDHRVHKPTPISREDFHAVYNAAVNWPSWQPRLMLMLNLCLHLDEVLDLEWTDFGLDTDPATFCTQRNKRGRVIRAATLWPNTLAALKTIKRTGSPHVLVSNRGARFNAKGQWKTWNRIRKAAGRPHIQLDDLRDGALTAAYNAPGIETKFADLFAGHATGVDDRYVERTPSIVKAACDAVYAHYFGK